jgi:hypothetical protein
MTRQPELAPEPSAPDEPVPNWLQRRRQTAAELEAMNQRGRDLADRFPLPPQRIYAGSLRRPRPRRR